MLRCLLIISLLFSGWLNAQLRITEIITKNDTFQADFAGDLNDLIEITNDGALTINLADYYLSDKFDHPNKWQFPNTNISPGQILVVHASNKDTVANGEIHTNFRLQQDNAETVLLSDLSLNTLDAVTFPCIPENHSFAWLGGNFMLDSLPSMGQVNSTNGRYSITQDSLLWSHDAGLYHSPVSLNISSYEGYDIKLSTDGAYPSPSQNNFSGSLTIDESYVSPLSMIVTSDNWEAPDGPVMKGTIVAAQTFYEDCPVSAREKRTFIVSSDASTRYPAVVSISFKDEDLFGNNGIYVAGETGANYEQRGRDWERDVYFEYFDKNGQRTVHTPGGLRISGKGSRRGPQKSIRLYLRDDYGTDSIQNFAWNDRPDSLYMKRLVVRSGYSDFLKSLVRDHLLSKTLEGTEMDYQASDPVVLFMNGEYWGIQFLKERHDAEHLSRKHGISEEGINIIENDGLVSNGNGSAYAELMRLARNTDLKESVNYQAVIDRIDLLNYVDYMITNMYLANWDWPFRNVKVWNSDLEHPKFRWLVFDGDAMFYKSSADFFEKLLLEKDEADLDYILFAALMENREFQELFKLRAINLISTTFHPDRMIKIIDDLENELTPFLPEHIKRWHHPTNLIHWHEDLNEMRLFLQSRPQNFLHEIEKEFDMSFQVFPNPSRDKLNLPDTFYELNLSYQIFNRTGQKVMEGKRQSGEMIDIFSLNPGVFTLRVMVDGTALYSKFVKF